MGYQLRKSKRSKHVRLAVYGDGRVVVSAPSWLGSQTIERFVADKMEWLREALGRVKSRVPRRSTRGTVKEFQARKDEALLLVRERITELNQRYGFSVNRITIRNQKSRWGSCSSQKNLSFNFRILFLTPEEQDYVIVHELCHLQEMNHSARFWALVAKSIPEYRSLRRALRKRSLSLM